MAIVVGVAFKEAGKVYYFDPAGIELKVGDEVIASTARGDEFGQVMMGPEEVSDGEITQPLKPVLRKATESDLARLKRNKEKEEEAFTACEKKIEQHGLEMKLIDVEQVFDGSKLIFYFTADGRVDFRELVKDLAQIFKTRIELRQVGVRDEAKMIGGFGICGQRLCCTLFLNDFEPVSIRMAKEQDLPLNPSKISGVCGRLMCCLKYEHCAYKDFKKRAPARGTEVNSPHGRGVVVDYNVPKERVVVELESGARQEIALAEVEKLSSWRK
ncbi:MAG: stage 0 sporulation family protein [Actinomycetota bacterium]|nr:stage 0 sporulation family protein [Actinomycetota bacterium]